MVNDVLCCYFSVRTGWSEREPNAHKIIPMLQKISKGRIAAVMVRLSECCYCSEIIVTDARYFA
jgi:hypothetical protein